MARYSIPLPQAQTYPAPGSTFAPGHETRECRDPEGIADLLRQGPRRIGKPCLLALGRDSQALSRKKTEIKNLDALNVAEINQCVENIEISHVRLANRRKSATCA